MDEFTDSALSFCDVIHIKIKTEKMTIAVIFVFIVELHGVAGKVAFIMKCFKFIDQIFSYVINKTGPFFRVHIVKIVLF